MKKIVGSSLFSRLCVYALIVSVNMLYMPLTGIQAAFAASDEGPSVYLLPFGSDSEDVPIEIRGLLEETINDSLQGDGKINAMNAKDVRKALKGEKKKTKYWRSVSKKAKKKDFGEAFHKRAKRFCKYIDAEYLGYGHSWANEDETLFVLFLYEAKSDKLFQLPTHVVFNEEMGDIPEEAESAYMEFRNAILKDKPSKVLAVGAVPVPELAAEEAPVPADDFEDDFEEEEAEEEYAPEPEPEPEPEPPVYEEALDLSSSGSLMLSQDDQAKAEEDSEAEESIAPVAVTPVYKKWWFWTIIGVVVVGGAVGAGVALQPEDNSRTSSLSIPNPSGN